MHPKLRPLDAQLINHNGQDAILLRERLGLADRALVVPRALGLLLALCDGTRDPAMLGAAFELRTGLRLDPVMVEGFLHQLDEALLLDTPRAAAALAQALEDYRSAPHRSPSCAGRSYPADAGELRKLLDGYLADVDGQHRVFDGKQRVNGGSIKGIISPHIDFQRGGPVYAATWRLAEEALKAAEVVVILGTDHAGPDTSQATESNGRGEVTLTRQNYASPLGVMPTCQGVVDAVIGEIGTEAAFANELNHRNEHSIELALVWLQHLLGTHRCEIVPILCGSFHRFSDGSEDPAQREPLRRFIGALRDALAGRTSVIVAAADLAHVGPAFGDAFPYGSVEKSSLKIADTAMLAAASTGDAARFLGSLVEEQDRRRVCGLPPIYLALELLGDSKGELIDYAQCSADDNNTSVVSICGMLFG